MKFYAAPLEGITGYLYRRAHHRFFPGTDKYFIPFIAPRQNGRFTARELRDIAPELNAGVPAVPQILANDAQGFIHTARELHALGYDEVNLNLGCPSPTVVTKGKGSGFLAYPQQLERFLTEIYSSLDFPISIKTRIGKVSCEEAPMLLDLFNRFPIAELTVHPRLQTDGYHGKPNFTVYGEWLAQGTNPLCYNGNLFTTEDYTWLTENYPQTRAVMLGRGLLANPALIRELKGGNPVNKEELRTFSDCLYSEYCGFFPGQRSTLYKLKEMWFYQARLFTDYEKYLTRIQKAATLGECEIAVATLFREQELRPGAGYDAPAKGGKIK